MSTDATIKTNGLLQLGENEIEAARTMYLRAYDEYVENPTIVNRNEMYTAYEKLNQIKRQYADARNLLIQKRIIDQQ